MAIAVIPVAVIAILIAHRRDWSKAARLSLAFGLPVIATILFECSLNRTYAGQFRTSTGTVGSCMWAHRIRTFQGAAIPNTKEARLLVDLLPERGVDEAFVSNDGDQWVAGYRAVRDKGWNDWEYGALCRRAALASIRSEPGAFLRSSARLALHHLLRLDKGMALSPVPEAERRGYLPHPAARDAEEAQANWHAYWSLPHLTLDESTRLVARVKAEASERAPIGFDNSGVWSTLRYWKSKPVVVAVLSALSWLGSLWPGFALLLCAPLRLNRTTCYLLAGMYLAEAILLSMVTVTDARYQSVWVAIDTTLAAAVPAVVLAGIVHRAWARLSGTPAQSLPG